MSDDRTLPIRCPACGFESETRYDNAMRTKYGEYIYRRGITILHRCRDIETALTAMKDEAAQIDGSGGDDA